MVWPNAGQSAGFSANFDSLYEDAMGGVTIDTLQTQFTLNVGSPLVVKILGGVGNAHAT